MVNKRVEDQTNWHINWKWKSEEIGMYNNQWEKEQISEMVVLIISKEMTVYVYGCAKEVLLQ